LSEISFHNHNRSQCEEPRRTYAGHSLVVTMQEGGAKGNRRDGFTRVNDWVAAQRERKKKPAKLCHWSHTKSWFTRVNKTKERCQGAVSVGTERGGGMLRRRGWNLNKGKGLDGCPGSEDKGKNAPRRRWDWLEGQKPPTRQHAEMDGEVIATLMGVHQWCSCKKGGGEIKKLG